jgi:hypothetical protein
LSTPVKRVAVREEQIAEWDLPTRPTKRSEGNTHAKNFKGDSVEVDAIEPSKLQELVGECIEQHVDMRQLEIIRAAEASEKAMLDKFLTLGKKGRK